MLEKFISIRDEGSGSATIFALPERLRICVKTSTDGIDIAIHEDEENLHRVHLHPRDILLPDLKAVLDSGLGEWIEEQVLSRVMSDVHKFYAGYERIFIIETHVDKWMGEINDILSTFQGLATGRSDKVSACRQ